MTCNVPFTQTGYFVFTICLACILGITLLFFIADMYKIKKGIYKECGGKETKNQ